jgi:hypothetical protein
MYGNNVNEDVIGKISRLFLDARKSSHGKIYYSEDLRGLVLSAIAGGHSAGSVSKAAGISKSSIYFWLRSSRASAMTKRQAPVRLRVVKSERTQDESRLRVDHSSPINAQIRFRSGAVMEIDARGITETLILALNGGEL